MTFLLYADENFGLLSKINGMKNLILRFSLLTLFAFPVLAHAQQTSPTLVATNVQPAVKTYQFKSRLMARQMPYGVVLPATYEIDKQRRFPVIYLLHGLGDSHQTYPREVKHDERHRFILVFVEGGTGFYTDSATNPNDKYESYFVNELIAEVDKNFRTEATRKGRAVFGVSMGGYGALKYGIKYPQMFALAASGSGAVNIASWRKVEELPPIPRLVQVITSVFGDGKNPAPLIANDLFRLFTEFPSDKINELPFFYLDCGTEDELQLLKPNQRLAEIMLSRKIPHEYRHFPGGHGVMPPNQYPDLYELSERIFAQQKATSSGK